jgi:4-hydroxybenzoate polyprenyltransferase
MLSALLRASRPRQWIKNLFVGAPLIFAKHLTDEPMLARAAAAVVAFCVISAAVYLWNDIVDVEKDRAHPVKRFRPIASGELSIPVARTFSVLFAVSGLVASFLLSPWMALCAGIYLTLNVAYSLRLKHVPYVDVLVIASGFLLRVLAGAFAVDVDPSRWLLVCTALLAAFVGFGKRAHELEIHGPKSRRVLAHYHRDWLRFTLYATGAATVVAYTLYTRAEHTRLFFHTDHMWWTIPCIGIGVGRFLQLTSQPKADSPTEEMLRDPLFMANIAAWVFLVVALIYFAP